MSTKIYNGYCFKKQMSAIDLLNWCLEIKKELIVVQSEIYYKQLIERIEWLYEKIYEKRLDQIEKMLSFYNIKHSLKDTSIGYLAYLIIEEMHKKDSIFNLDASLTLYPMEDKTLFMLFGQEKEYIDVIISNPLVEEYMYWNNSDEPEDISAEEWANRKRIWNLALGKTGIPKDQGFIFELLEKSPFYSYNLIDLDLITTKLPSVESRAKYLAKNRILNKIATEAEDPVGAIIDASQQIETTLKEIIDSQANEILISKPIITNATLKTPVQEIYNTIHGEDK